VVVIVSILASISYPSYREYAVRTNRTEAKTALLQVTQVLEKCYTRVHTYTGCVIATGDTPSQLYSIGATIPADGQTYTLKATPKNGQSKDKCGVLSVDNTNKRLEKDGQTLVPANKCW